MDKAQKANNPQLVRHSVRLLCCALRLKERGGQWSGRKTEAYARTSQVDSDGRMLTLAGIITRREIIQSSQRGIATGTTVSCQVELLEHVSDLHGSISVLMDKGNIAQHLIINPNVTCWILLTTTLSDLRDSLDVRETQSSWFRLSWSFTFIRLLQFFVTGSDESVWRHSPGEQVSPHYPAIAQITLSLVTWGVNALCFIAWHSFNHLMLLCGINSGIW